MDAVLLVSTIGTGLTAQMSGKVNRVTAMTAEPSPNRVDHPYIESPTHTLKEFTDERNVCMNVYMVTYHLRPDAEDVTIRIKAQSEDEAITIAKSYMIDGFSIKEIEEDTL